MQQMVDPETLDEIYWRGQPIIDYYGGNLNMNNVLHYFNQSPFSLAISNNSALFIQATHNQALGHIIWNRNAFEKRLLSMIGEEFRIIYPPPLPEPPINPTPAQLQQYQASIPQFRPDFFVIRRQTRIGPNLDDVRPKTDYYIVNGNVYQAPLVEKVIGNHTLAISRALRDTEKLVRELRELRDAPTAASAPSTQTQTSSTQPAPQSQAAQTLRTQKRAIEKQHKEAFLAFSLNAATKFSEDYMDAPEHTQKPKDTLAQAQIVQKNIDKVKRKEEEKAEEMKPVAAVPPPVQQGQGPQVMKKQRKKSKANINVGELRNGEGSAGGGKTVTVGR